jgi:hypothetical protein
MGGEIELSPKHPFPSGIKTAYPGSTVVSQASMELCCGSQYGTLLLLTCMKTLPSSPNENQHISTLIPLFRSDSTDKDLYPPGAFEHVIIRGHHSW